jgi:hypothetical protein
VRGEVEGEKRETRNEKRETRNEKLENLKNTIIISIIDIKQ